MGYENARMRFTVCKDRAFDGYRVLCEYLPGLDEMWESFTHFALFESYADASAFGARVRELLFADPKRWLDRRYWEHRGSECSPLGAENWAPAMETKPRPTLHW